MAVGLKRLFGPAPTARRRVAWGLLVLGVIAVHGCVTDEVVDRMSDLAADREMPARMEVSYVREMALSAAPLAAKPAAPPPPIAPQRAAPPAKPASAPKPVTPAVTVARAPDPPPEPKPEPPRETQTVEPPPTVAVGAAVATAAAPGAAASSSGALAFEWPASTRVSYQLTGNYRGEVSGSAQVEWVRTGSHYQVHVDFIVGPTMAPLITQRSTSDGEITTQGLAPRRYDQDIKFLVGTRPRQTVLFDAGYVVLSNGEVHPALPGVQDTASQFVQLTYLFSTRPELLRVGGSVDVPLALPRKLDVWTYDVVEVETLATPLGPIEGIHLKPRKERKPGTLAVEMWFAPQLRYFPARLRFEQDANTYVDLLISKPPEQAK